MTEDPKVKNALAVFDQEGGLVKYSITTTALTMPDGCDFPTVEKMLNGFKTVGDAVKFWRGDLLVYAQRNFGEMYSQLVDDSDYAYQSLKDEMWVAHSVSPTVRRTELSWSHHVVVAPLEKKEQQRFLALAIEQQLSAAALRRLVKGETVEKDKAPSRADAYESALRAILRGLIDSEFFNEKFFSERLEVSEGITPQELVVTKAAIIASDTLRAYKKE